MILGFQFFLSIIASTLPIPSGNFVPVFKIGCAFGRMSGEIMHLMYPHGIQFSGDMWPIIPGIQYFSSLVIILASKKYSVFNAFTF